MHRREPSATKPTRRKFLARSAIGLGAVAAGAATTSPAAPAQARRDGTEYVRMGFIGVGGRGSTHLRTMLPIPGVEVTWVCDLLPERMERAARRVTGHGGKKPALTRDHRKVLDAKDVDAVLIATPCDVHARLYLDAIAAGKDLYAEKPLAITVEECDRVVSAAEQSKGIVQIGFQSRYDPRIREGMERIHRGDFGEVLEVRGSYLAHFGPLRDWRSHRAHSGDWMVEQAVHFFDIMNWAFGATPTQAYGWGRTDVFTEGEPDRDVTDYYSALIEYPGGIVVNWLHSWLCPAGGNFNRNTMQFMGRKGAVDINGGTIEYMDRGRAKETLRPTGENPTRRAEEAFLECVRTRKPPAATVRHGRDAVLVGLLVRNAVDDRRLARWAELRA